jgi:ABC-2 type transport system permease protein
VGYAMLGLLGGLYNIFGADGAGVQLYLLAPMRLRDVIVAKNISSLTLLTIEALMAWCVVLVMATAPVTLSTQLSTFFWVVFIIFANLSFGTLRSIQAPRKVTLAQTRAIRPASASRTSGLLVLAVLIGGMLLQIPVTLLCRYFQNPWLAIVCFAPLAAVAIGAYALLLQNADRLILNHRDTFAQELSGS